MTAPKILIVDDRPENLLALRLTLKPLDCQVFEAADGNTALSLTLHHDFVLALLDVQMPGMDGYELAGYLRGEPATQSLPILFLSAAYSDDLHVFQGYESGGFDFLIKPYEPQVLLSKVSVFLELARQRALLSSRSELLEELVRERTESLAHQVEETEAIMEGAPVALLLTDEIGTITRANAAAVELLGYAPEVLLGQSLALVLPDDEHLWHESLRAAAGTHGPFQLAARVPVQRKDGTRFHAHGAVRATETPRGRRFVVALLDLTERLQLDEVKTHLATITENTNDLVCYASPTGELRYMNPSGQRLLGAKEGSPLPLGHLADFLDAATHDELLRSQLSRLLRGDVWRGETRLLAAGDEWIPVQLVATARAHMPHQQGTLYLVAEDLREAKLLREKEARLERGLRQSAKLEAIGQLAGGIAHDFNNLLTAINAFTSAVHETLDASDDRKADLEEVLKASRRGAELTRQLLIFSRRDNPNRTPTSLCEVVQNLLKLLRRTLGEHVELTVTPCSSDSTIGADPSEIDQLILNLAVNARDAMPEGGTLDLRVDWVTLPSEEAGPLKLAVGDYVRLRVADTGIGMDAETLEHIFEPFFTTKVAGSGTGMGLATCHGIVRDLGGAIDVQSTPGQGSCFSVYVPHATTTAAAVESAVVDDDAPCGAQTVLVVEDDDAVRRATARALATWGFTVLSAVHGQDALRVLAEHPEVDVVVTDVVMPVLDGYGLVARLRDASNPVPVVLVSGYPDKMRRRRGAGSTATPIPDLPLVRKPFTRAELVTALREAMRQRAPATSE